MMADNSYVTRMSLVVDAVYGNYPPVFDQENFDPRVIGEWNVSGLTPGKYYKITVSYYAEGASGWAANCGSNANVTYLSSCRMNPNPLNLTAVGQTGTLNSENVDAVGRVTYGITNGQPHNVVTVNQNVDITFPYSTSVTAIGNDTTSVTNESQLWVGGATQNWVTYCTDTATVNVGLLPTTPIILPFLSEI
jgi:hypothetical protein